MTIPYYMEIMGVWPWHIWSLEMYKKFWNFPIFKIPLFEVDASTTLKVSMAHIIFDLAQNKMPRSLMSQHEHPMKTMVE